MNVALRRGACPSLSAPMQTGDGLLVRLKPADGVLTPSKLAGIAEAAARHGNGILEITARGSLQIRGLTEASAANLRDAIADLDIAAREALSVECGPLAGLDAAEIADPRPLAEEIRAHADALALGARLAPKVSVVVDGGGALPMRGLPADVRLEAVEDSLGAKWRVAIGGDGLTPPAVALADAGEAATVTLAILSQLAAKGREARARDVSASEISELGLLPDAVSRRAAPTPVHPAGQFRLKDGTEATGFCLALGQTTGRELVAFADAAEGARQIRLSHGRGMLVLGLTAGRVGALAEVASRLGLVTERDDPRLRIIACAGAPACASANLATRSLAAELAARPDVLQRTVQLHLSGCQKRCAQPPGPTVSLVGRARGYDLTAEGTTVTAPLRAFLANRADHHLLAGMVERR